MQIQPAAPAAAPQAVAAAPATTDDVTVAHVGRVGARPSEPMVSRDLEQRSLDNIQRVIGRTRDFFSQYGIGEDRGNGPVKVAQDFSFPNAAYIKMEPATVGARQAREGVEMLLFGVAPETGLPFGLDDDVVVHEYAHRVINNIVDLHQPGQPGTVGEHLADVVAAVLDDTDPWTIGERVVPGGMRSMSEPDNPRFDHVDRHGRARPMPGHMADFVRTSKDNGGVHINVGIPNRAAALIGKELGRERLGDIYMNAILNHLPDEASFGDAARATISSAAQLYGRDSDETAAVRDAWLAVAS